MEKMSNIIPDHYKILGVDPNATPDQIKDAYRALIFQFHPNVAASYFRKNAEIITRELNEAWGVLKDTEKRRAYDTRRVFSQLDPDSEIERFRSTWREIDPKFSTRGDVEKPKKIEIISSLDALLERIQPEYDNKIMMPKFIIHHNTKI